MKILGVRLKVSTLFIGLVALEIISGAILPLVSMMLSLFVHEISHLVVSRYRGCSFSEIRLEPYGATLIGDMPCRDIDRVIVSISGPIASGIFAIVSYLSYLLVRADILYHLFVSNLGLMVYNVLPCYPLDGSGVILGLSKSKYKTARVVRMLGYMVGGGLIVAFVISLIFTTPMLSYLIGGAFLIANARSCLDVELSRIARLQVDFLSQKRG